jgi:hypothetical protein
VFIAFDSDAMTKPSVHSAMSRLKALLEQRGARAHLIHLPQNGSNGKTGLDDFFAAGHSIDDLLALACDEIRELPRHDTDGEFAGPYRLTPTGLSWAKPTREGEILVPLTNFSAKIVGQVVEDDGVETRRLIEIEAHLNDRLTRFAVTANEFSGMNWPLQHLGAMAIIHAGFGLREHARSALQILSGDVPERRVYAHTGWRLIGKVWHYLHTGGAIGPNGPVEGVEVHLPEALRHFNLRHPQDQVELHTAVRSSMSLLEVAPDHIVFPLFSAIWRAAMNSADFSLHLAGPTGAGKSVLAALSQQHWGGDMDGRHLPGSWSSTGNALEAVAFAAKDALLVVDDFAPSGSTSDVARLHREADRLLRAQGNSAGRLRMRADASLRPQRPPRGMILSSGEDVPRGESLRSRLLVVELSPNMLQWEKISACQRDAERGLYASAMAGFVQWLAAQRDRVMLNVTAELSKLREDATSSGRHKRIPEIVANLALGLRYFLAFAQQIGVLDGDLVSNLWQRGWKALGESAATQAAHQAAAEPTGRFIQLLRAAISSGHAHVAGREGGAPEHAGVWGWHERGEEWQSQGALVGWLDADDLYLEPASSFAAAQSLARDMGDGFPISARTLHKRLHERGLLASVERGRNTLTTRRVLAGSRRVVLHMQARVVMPAGADQPAHDDHDVSETAPDGQYRGQLPTALLAGTAQLNCPEDPFERPNESAPASVGSLGGCGEGKEDRMTDTSDTNGTEVTIPRQPERPCCLCKGTRFWRCDTGPFVCAVCHPPARPESVIEWTTSDDDGAKS